MPGPSSQSPFVGRENELELLLAAFADAAAGQGSLVMVVGEPGIGKTALCGRLASHVSSLGGRVLIGRCYEEGSLSLPYLPFIDALRPYILEQETAALAEELGSGAIEVARILPELRGRLATEPEPAASAGPEEARYRLYEAVATFMQNAARDRPLLLVLEDLHDADRGTLDLLVHLVRRQTAARLLIAGTYRDVEVNRVHPLSSALAELRRVAPIERLHLRGLATIEVQEMMEGVAGQPVPESLAAAVQSQTEGNPLFAQEVTRYLVGEGLLGRGTSGHVPTSGPELPIGIPEGLRDVIGKRLSSLSPGCNRLLALASVFGREFSLESLEAVAGMGEEELEDALEEATRAAVLEESSANRRAGGARYRFTHAFFRQTLFEELSAPRRIRMHQLVGRALERQYASRLEEHAAELAEHYSNSSDPLDLRKAVEYGELAAQRALMVFAYGEGARCLEQALRAQEVLDPDNQAKRCDLLLALGRTLLSAGEPLRVSGTLAPEALALAEALGDRLCASRACELALEALQRHGSAAVNLGPEYWEWAQRADRFAAPGTPERARADQRLGVALTRPGRFGEAWVFLNRAHALAREIDDAETLFLAPAMFVTRARAQDLEESRRVAEELTARSRTGVAATRVIGALWNCGIIFLSWGERDSADGLWREMADLESRTHESAFGSWIREIWLAALDGRLEEAVALAPGKLAQAEAGGMAVAGRLWIRWAAARPQVYLGDAEEALTATPNFFADPSVATMRLLYLAHAGRRQEALDLLRRLIADRGIRDGEDAAAGSLTVLLEAAVTVEDRESAALLAERLAPAAALAPGAGAFLPSCVARHLGAAAALLGDPLAARTYYGQALEVAGKIRSRPEIALTHLGLADLLLEDADEVHRNEALDHLDLARAELRDMKMQPALDRALRLEQRLRGNRPAAPRKHPDGLSDREVEVLGLVAAGRSNNEVAAELVLSVHTVERHLANIYRKIGARGRADAAVYAVHHRLTAANTQ